MLLHALWVPEFGNSCRVASSPWANLPIIPQGANQPDAAGAWGPSRDPSRVSNMAGRLGMRRLLFLGVFASMALANGGCLVSSHGSDPNSRVEGLINQSEDLRQVRNEWRRIWFTDQPSHLTPERVHGGIQ